MHFPTGFPELTFRAIEPAIDLPALVEIYNRSHEATGSDSRLTVERLEVSYGLLDNCHLPTDSLIVERDGAAVGYTRAVWRQEVNGPRTLGVYALVVPEERGTGLTETIVGWVESRGREVAAGASNAEWEAWVGEGDAELIEIVEARGYKIDTLDSDMVRPSLDNIGGVNLPNGVEIRPVVPEHFQQIWDAGVEAFRDHYGFAGASPEAYRRFVESPLRSEHLWQIAWYDDDVIGQVRTFIDHDENEEFSRLRGYTEDISTSREWRGKGIASSLINASLEDLKERGFTEAALGVHLENKTGALDLYERLGYVQTHKWMTYRKPVPMS